MNTVTSAAALPGTGSTTWRSVEKRVALVWGALFLNVLTFADATVLPIPGPLGQLLTQGALVIALGVGLTVNPRAVMRPNAFVLILTLAAVVAMMVSIHAEF